jgi:heme-degrading monooxygenase HmoA
MQKILVDQFVVPEESKARFLEAAQKVQRFLKSLPGFVEEFLYEKKEGEGRHNYITTAVWENQEAFENAAKTVATEFKRQGYDPEQTRRELRMERERSVYERSPYSDQGGVMRAPGARWK